jgi:hypothetical protein
MASSPAFRIRNEPCEPFSGQRDPFLAGSRSPPPRCHLICFNLGSVRGLGIDWQFSPVSPRHAQKRRALAAQSSPAKSVAMLLAHLLQAICRREVTFLLAESRRNMPSGRPGLCVYRAYFEVGQYRTRHLGYCNFVFLPFFLVTATVNRRAFRVDADCQY